MAVDHAVAEALKQAAPDGKITCTVARRLAERLQVSPMVIGQACNELKIKIKACELGCF
ncbi:MAG: hypothetical protein QHH02_00795 [Syntrophomonadaceae bacterium]|nr:hypothetical protein [Syntrophomonadaceae bacterium]